MTPQNSGHASGHGTSQPVTPHEPVTPVTTTRLPARNTDHGSGHATHTPKRSRPLPPPLRGRAHHTTPTTTRRTP
jgi:hypothetical protein